MKKVLFLAVAAMSLSLASCDSKKEDNAEATGTAVKEAGEVKADSLENKADAVRDSADKKGEAIGDAADAKDPK
jgi:protein involved in sex pheromone biosynthesis